MGSMGKKRPGRVRALLANIQFMKDRVSRDFRLHCIRQAMPPGSGRNNFPEEFQSQPYPFDDSLL
jgi:hypothetical protein